MEKKNKRTIIDVLNVETGECINADDFFKKPLDELHRFRSELQKAIEGFREPLFKCYYCKQKIRIRGGINSLNLSKAEIFHFAHLKDSDDCHIKTKNKYTREEVDRIKYNGEKESILHLKLKHQIAECLLKNQSIKNEISDLKIEEAIIDKVAKEWKKPDINAKFFNKHIAIELQLSTTWLDVITRRQQFYKTQGIYIFWVFHTFNINDCERKLTFNDVIYTNNQNAYVFNNETYELSKTANDLILKCYYKNYSRNNLNIEEEWKSTFIKLSDLTFDNNKFRIYYHDSDEQKKRIENEIEELNNKLYEDARIKFQQDLELEKTRLKQIKELEKIRLEKIKKKEELKGRIDFIRYEMQGVNYNKSEIENKIQTTNYEIKEITEFISKITEQTEKIIEYLLSSKRYSKPYFLDEEFVKYLDENITKQLKEVNKIFKEKEIEQKDYKERILRIENLSKMEIGGKLYSQINQLSDWNFIKQNYQEIKLIQKNLIGGLFAANEIKTIKNTFELNTLQFSNNFIFLIDLSSKIINYNEILKLNEKIIEQQQATVIDIKEKISSVLKKYFEQKIFDSETNLKKHNKSKTELDIELNKRENELSILENELTMILE